MSCTPPIVTPGQAQTLFLAEIAAMNVDRALNGLPPIPNPLLPSAANPLGPLLWVSRFVVMAAQHAAMVSAVSPVPVLPAPALQALMVAEYAAILAANPQLPQVPFPFVPTAANPLGPLLHAAEIMVLAAPTPPLSPVAAQALFMAQWAIIQGQYPGLPALPLVPTPQNPIGPLLRIAHLNVMASQFALVLDFFNCMTP